MLVFGSIAPQTPSFWSPLACEFFSRFDITALTAFIAAAQQQYEFITSLLEIYAVAGAVMGTIENSEKIVR